MKSHETLRRGITLLEVIVVTSIIAGLLALLMPTFARAKENAKIARSKSNLKQIHLALSTYCEDHDGTFRSLPPQTTPFYKNHGLSGLLHTGGRPLGTDPHSDVYRMLWPRQLTVPPDEWSVYAASVSDPAIITDETFPGTLVTGPFVSVHVTALTFGGSVTSKFCRGIPGLYYKRWR